MKQTRLNQTVIFLCERTAGSYQLKEWLEKSKFLTSEARDIFQALETVSDFTVSDSPDVILLEVNSLKEDFIIVREAVHAFAAQGRLPIFALSGNDKIINDKECFEGNFTKLTAELDKVILKRAYTHAAA